MVDKENLSRINNGPLEDPYIIPQQDKNLFVVTGNLQEVYEGGRIVELTALTESQSLKIGQERLLSYNKHMRVGFITRVNPKVPGAWRVYSYRYTMSRDIILPLYKEIYQRSNGFGDGFYLANVYLQDTRYYQEFGSQVLFLLRQTGEYRSSKLDTTIMSEKGFQGAYEPDRYYKLYSFDPTDHLLRLWDNLLDGKYSQFDRDIQNIIIRHTNNQNQRQYWSAVFTRSDVLRQVLSDEFGVEIPRGGEVRSKIDIQQEIYDNEKFRCKMTPDIEPEDPSDAFSEPNEKAIRRSLGGNFRI